MSLKFQEAEPTLVLNGLTGTQYAGYVTYNNVPFVYNFENGKEYTLAINMASVLIYSGDSISTKDHIVSFNMRNGQIVTHEYGKRVR